MKNPKVKVLRGGSWFSSRDDARAHDRVGGYPSHRYKLIGFRVVCETVSELETEFRVVRGGSWLGDQDFARAGHRDQAHSFFRGDGIGFRMVTEPVKKHQHQPQHRCAVHGGSHLSDRNFVRVGAYLYPRSDHYYRSIGFRVIRIL